MAKIIGLKEIYLWQYTVTRMLEIKDLDSLPAPSPLPIYLTYFNKWHYHKLVVKPDA